MFQPILGLALAMGFGFVGCADMPTVLPTEAQLTATGSLAEGTPADSLWRGRALVVTHCMSCHRFFFPYEYAPHAWPALISDMGGRAGFTQRQIGDATRYMVATSRATRPQSESAASNAAPSPADPDTVLRGKTLALARCVQCHRFYQPHEFSPAAWPGIVRSMARLASFTDSEIRELTSYFVQTAQQGK
jgi:mono/diheme cytochrome c family protein